MKNNFLPINNGRVSCDDNGFHGERVDLKVTVASWIDEHAGLIGVHAKQSTQHYVPLFVGEPEDNIGIGGFLLRLKVMAGGGGGVEEEEVGGSDLTWPVLERRGCGTRNSARHHTTPWKPRIRNRVAISRILPSSLNRHIKAINVKKKIWKE